MIAVSRQVQCIFYTCIHITLIVSKTVSSSQQTLSESTTTVYPLSITFFTKLNSWYIVYDGTLLSVGYVISVCLSIHFSRRIVQYIILCIRKYILAKPLYQMKCFHLYTTRRTKLRFIFSVSLSTLFFFHSLAKTFVYQKVHYLLYNLSIMVYPSVDYSHHEL